MGLELLVSGVFEILKQKVGEDICLKGIDYSEGAGDLKLAVD